MANEITLKTSRKKFILFYIFAILLIFLYPNSYFYSQGGIYNYIFFLILFISLAYPEIKIASSVYIITRENIIEIKGIITKRKTVIPFTSISHVVMNKTIGGIIMGYGDIIISSYRDVCIVFEGISNAEKITEIIEKRVESEKRI